MQNINPRTWNANQVAKKRGRKPGQLKGTKYDVPKRVPITIYVDDEVVNELNAISEVLQSNRSQIVTRTIQNWVMRGKPTNLLRLDKSNTSFIRHNCKSQGRNKAKKSISINLPELAFRQVDEASFEKNSSRSVILGSIIEDVIARGVLLPSEELA
jgi:metal-responsive CopG/Arc/MetJ family transcriptional regulator|tara:strand:+ start:1348 stop:1815 length:468 start_codon:yes stop_codon:yes gene_type:complete